MLIIYLNIHYKKIFIFYYKFFKGVALKKKIRMGGYLKNVEFHCAISLIKTVFYHGQWVLLKL